MIDYNELAEYVARAKEHDEAAFVCLYESTSNLAYNIACSVLGDVNEAQDVVQEVYIKVYTRIQMLRDNSSFIRWLHVITVNTCQDHIKSRSGMQLPVEIGDTRDDPDLFDDWFEKQCRSEILSQMIDALPPAQMRTVYRYYYDQLSLGDIAALDNCSINTVKSRLFYARNTLKKAIEAEEERMGEKLRLPAAVTAMSAMMLLPQFSYALSSVDSARILAAVFAAVSTGYVKDSVRVIADVNEYDELDENGDAVKKSGGILGALLRKSWFVRLKASFFITACTALLLVCSAIAVTSYAYGISDSLRVGASGHKTISVPVASEAASAPDTPVERIATEPSDNIIVKLEPTVASTVEFTYQIVGSGAVITNVVSTAEHVEIPSELGGCPVVKIGERAFSNNIDIVSVKIPSSVEIIGEGAFALCSRLKTVDIEPGGLLKIECDAFKFCVELAYMKLPDGIQILEENVFRSSGLCEIVLPQSLLTIGPGCFRECEKLVKVDIPEKIDWITDNLFRNCTSLVSVTMGDHIRDIGMASFADCKSLEHIDLPDDLCTIHDFAFQRSGLRSVTIGEKFSYMDQYAFEGCEQLESVMISSKMLQRIETHAIKNCDNLKTITFMGGVPKDWEDDAIIDCDALTIWYKNGQDGWTDDSWRAPDGTVYATKEIS